MRLRGDAALMETDLLSGIISQTFDLQFKFATPRISDRGMLVSLRLHHDYKEVQKEDYYPRADLLLLAPGNYVKVYVRERDIHHYGTGPWVKIHDHDSCWRDGVKNFLAAYASSAYGFDSLSNWYETVPVNERELPREWGKIEAASHLPGIRRGKL